MLRADNLTIFMCRLSENPGSLNLVEPLWTVFDCRVSFTFLQLYPLSFQHLCNEGILIIIGQKEVM